MKTESFDVIGMTCAACQANVTKAVEKLDGVQQADVSLLANSMKVEFDPDKTGPKEIEKAVEAIGYEAVLKGSALNESAGSMQQEWNAKQEKAVKEMKHKKRTVVLSVILLLVLMCFSMLPMFGIFSVLMEMEWMMVSGVVQLVLCMVIMFIQKDFFTHGFKALLHKAPNMDSLVAIGSMAAYLYGLYGLLYMAYGYGIMDHEIIHQSMDALYFESAATILTLVSLGKYLEARSKAKTGDALSKLVDLSPKTAWIEQDGVPIEVEASQVVSGDTVIVRPGMQIPVDGIVISGEGLVNQAAITGESVPVEKEQGDPVMSGTLNMNGSFKFTATKVGENTTLSQIIKLVEEAGSTKAPIARLADKVSGWFVPAVMIIALITLIGWVLAGKGFPFALNCAIAVLVISCPCALGLATPLAIMVSSGKAAENGILVKSAAALETMQSVNTIVFDKTGTITSGKPDVVDIQVFDPNLTASELLAVAAAAESGSEHPLGKAIIEKAKKDKIAFEEPKEFEAKGGKGILASVQSPKEKNTYYRVQAGSLHWIEEERIPVSKEQREAIHDAASNGWTPLLFALDGKLAGVISVADTIRPTSRLALQLLQKKGIQTIMLTGDNARTAHAIGKGLALDAIISDVLPADKEGVIRALQDKGKIVAMVGDGINDAPALARADVGIAIGAGTDIAIESAEIVLMKDNLLDVVTAYDLSRSTIRNIKENLFWAFFYNCLGIPVAMGLLYPAFGILLSPMFGAAAMSLSSVTVCLNALRLRLFKAPAYHAKDIEETPAKEIKEYSLHEEGAKPENRSDEKPAEIEKTEAGNDAKEENGAQTLSFHVSGMSCAHCKAAVEKAALSVPGVTGAEVNLEKENLQVQAEKSDVKEAVEKAVADAGYEAKLESPDQEFVFHVDGMSCSHCQNAVTKALQEVPGVKSAQVDLESQTAAVAGDHSVTESALKTAVDNSGYEARF